MKKYVSAFLFFVLLTAASLPVQAVNSASVYGDAVSVNQGETVLIPVKIKYLSGMMGFRITVNYPASVFSSPKAMRGALTAAGNFNDSITNSTNGSFDVLWSDTKNITGNGVLFTLQFTILQTAKSGIYNVGLSFTQPDTFNEAWEDVKLDCSGIKVTVGAVNTTAAQVTTTPGNTSTTQNPAATAASSTTPAQATTTPGTAVLTTAVNGQAANTTNGNAQAVLSSVDSRFLKNAIETALNRLGVTGIADLSNEQFEAFKKAVNESIAAYGAENLTDISADRDTYEKAYDEASKAAFVESVLDSANSAEIISAIDSVLAEYGVKSINDIPADKQKAFAARVTAMLEVNGAEPEKLPESFSGTQAVEAVKELYEKAKKERAGGKNVSEEMSRADADNGNQPANNSVIWIPASITAAVILITVFAVIVMNRKKRKTIIVEEEKNR